MGGPLWITATNLVIWTGLVVWIWRLDRRLDELERQP